MQTNIHAFGDSDDSLLLGLEPFQGYLYAGTYNWQGEGAPNYGGRPMAIMTPGTLRGSSPILTRPHCTST